MMRSDGGLAAARRPDEHQELAVRNLDVQIAHRVHVSESLKDVLELHTCHLLFLRRPLRSNALKRVLDAGDCMGGDQMRKSQSVGKDPAKRTIGAPQASRFFSASAAATHSGTSAVTSPPSCVISRTSVALRKLCGTFANRNTLSMSAASQWFVCDICSS